MMRNHKIVSTVNAMFLLGFVAQRIFGSFFSPFNSFLFLLSLRRFPLTSFRPTLKINAMPPLLGVHLFLTLSCFAADILAHPDKITFH